MPSGHQAQLHQDGLLRQPAVRRGGGRSAAWTRPAREQGLIKRQEHWPFRSAPESLDPRTLRLLWRQRELEIQALRWAIENHREARHCRILQEVAGLPAERSAAYCWSPACPVSVPTLTPSLCLTPKSTAKTAALTLALTFASSPSPYLALIPHPSPEEVNILYSHPDPNPQHVRGC